MKAIEKRDQVLYVSVRKSIRKWLKAEYKRLGYSTLAAYLDVLFAKEKARGKK